MSVLAFGWAACLAAAPACAVAVTVFSALSSRPCLWGSPVQAGPVSTLLVVNIPTLGFVFGNGDVLHGRRHESTNNLLIAKSHAFNAVMGWQVRILWDGRSDSLWMSRGILSSTCCTGCMQCSPGMESQRV